MTVSVYCGGRFAVIRELVPSTRCQHIGTPSRHIAKRSQPGLFSVRAESDPKLERPQAPTPPRPRPTTPEPEDSAEIEDTTEIRLPTIEFQRRRARAMKEYFESLALQEIIQQPVFGWTPNNEIGNGRWVMFGLLVGLLTEYATGVNIVDQIKLMISNLGIADIYD